jgi:pimeloyl-ACP methyl ester carboxylesterase
MITLKAVQVGLFLLTALTSFSLKAVDPWPDRVRFVAEDYQNPLDDRYLSTLHGTCYGPNIRERKMIVEVEDFRVKSASHESGEMPIKMGLQRDVDGRLLQAPVMFVIPGAWNNLDHRSPRALMHQFSRIGHHVVMFPNPWGTQYISFNPKAPTGSFEAEGEAIYNAIRTVHQELKKAGLIEDNITRVYGVSYGGFVAGMIAGLDAQHDRPVITQDITIVSPPFHIGSTLARLDDLIEETRDYIGLDFASLIRRFARVCNDARNFEDPDDRSLDDAKGLAASRGFHSELANSFTALSEVKGWDAVPYRRLGWLSPTYRQWFRSLNFESYYRKFVPGAMERAQSPEASLYHWINLASKSHAQTRVLVADDDFLNDYSQGIKWREAGDETIFLQHGGHYGFRSLYWYRQFINTAFFPEIKPN